MNSHCSPRQDSHRDMEFWRFRTIPFTGHRARQLSWTSAEKLVRDNPKGLETLQKFLEKKITKKTIKKQPPQTGSFSQVSLQQTSHLTDSPIYLLSWLDHTFALLFYTTGHCISGTRFTPSKPRTFCLAASPPPEGYPTQRYPEMGNLPSPLGMCCSG